jgi:hypothetical protein
MFHRASILGLLNNCHISIVDPYVGTRSQYANHRGVFKKARPARPQLLGRAERTEEYVSTAKERERRWRHFSTLPSWVFPFNNCWNMGHVVNQFQCPRGYWYCRVSPRRTSLLHGASRRARPLLWRQKWPKPVTPRQASLDGTDASLRRADQLAALRQGLLNHRSVRPLSLSAGVG